MIFLRQVECLHEEGRHLRVGYICIGTVVVATTTARDAIGNQLGCLRSKACHDKMISLVKRMLALHKQTAARTPQEQEMVKRGVESTDKGIDKLVYELPREVE